MSEQPGHAPTPEQQKAAALAQRKIKLAKPRAPLIEFRAIRTQLEASQAWVTRPFPEDMPATVKVYRWYSDAYAQAILQVDQVIPLLDVVPDPYANAVWPMIEGPWGLRGLVDYALIKIDMVAKAMELRLPPKGDPASPEFKEAMKKKTAQREAFARVVHVLQQLFHAHRSKTHSLDLDEEKRAAALRTSKRDRINAALEQLQKTRVEAQAVLTQCAVKIKGLRAELAALDTKELPLNEQPEEKDHGPRRTDPLGEYSG